VQILQAGSIVYHRKGFENILFSKLLFVSDGPLCASNFRLQKIRRLNRTIFVKIINEQGRKYVVETTALGNYSFHAR